MAKRTLKQVAQGILDSADILVDGDRPWDIVVHNPDFFARVFAKGSIGLGESYMDGWWDCQNLDQFFCKILKSRLDKKIKTSKHLILLLLKSKIINFQKRSKAYDIGEKHYDKGNDLYQAMLDKKMIYSCGYWKDASNLREAQEAKLDLICRKIGLKPGMKILDIGCGWGGFVKYAAEKYQAKAIGITVSKEQMKLAKENCKGLDVEIRMQDYRNLNEKFDRIVSVGMFEHVGYKNYRDFFKVVDRCLKDSGLFLLHTIGGNKSTTCADPWIDKYIFPNGMLPSASQIAKASEGIFYLEDWHSFGSHYDKTLMAWRKNFNKNWDKIKINYDERFYRMWDYYLLSFAGTFRASRNQLWQIVFSKYGVDGGYQSLR